MQSNRVTIPQEEASSPNRYSKTFGREQALDKMLAASDDKELLASLSKDSEPSDQVVDNQDEPSAKLKDYSKTR